MKKTYSTPECHWADMHLENSILTISEDYIFIPVDPGNNEGDPDVKSDNDVLHNIWDEEW